MSIRTEFYQAVNKANYYQPVKKEKKVVKETISFEEQIAQLIKESESAVIVDVVNIENEPIVEWVGNLYKKDENTLRKEKDAENLLREIEEKRDIARKEWRTLQKMQEKISTTFNPSAASSSSAAGGSKPVLSKYYQKGYIDPGYIE